MLVEITNEISEQQFSAIVEKLVKRINEQEIEKRLRSEIISNLKEEYLVLPLGTALEQAEKEVIRRTLDICKGNVSRAAEQLGIGRKTLHRKMNEYNIERQ